MYDLVSGWKLYFWKHHLVYFTTVSYQFLIAMTTNYHNVLTLKQQNTFFFHSSNDQKSNISIAGLKSMCWQAVLPGEVLGENLFLVSSGSHRPAFLDLRPHHSNLCFCVSGYKPSPCLPLVRIHAIALG